MTSKARWTVSARSTGEVLVARCDLGEISVVTFGNGSSSEDTERPRLQTLLQAARAAAGRDTAAGPIPAVLVQTLARLMASHFRPGSNGGALILFDDGQDATAGVVGDVEVKVALDEGTAQLPWIRLRDRAGREARAYPFPLSQGAQFTASWPQGHGDAPGRGVVIEARWAPIPPRGGLLEGSSSPRKMEARTATKPLESGGQPPGDAGFFQWLDRMVVRRGHDSNAAAPESAPPAPGSDWTTEPTTGAIPPIRHEPAVGHSETPHASGPEPGTGAASTGAAAPTMNDGAAEEGRSFVTAADPGAAFARDASVARVATPTPDAAAPMHDARPPHDAAPSHDAVPARDPAPARYAGPAYDESRLDDAPPARAVTPLRPAWPAADETDTPLWKRPWAWGLLLVTLLCGAIVFGGFMRRPEKGFSLLPTFGPRFSVTVNSRPPGAWIAVDGRDTGRLTPATVDLPPGEHQVTLSLTGRGAANYTVRGARDERVALDAALYGSVHVGTARSRTPVSVTLDGLERGNAPVTVEDLLPGPHEIRFRAEGLAPWTETFELRVGETHEVLARPFAMPETGMIDVRATQGAEDGADPLKGASVYVDGELRGTTPLTIKLPRGPHSVRVAHDGEDAPVQVIDLPGGNRRIAEFTFGAEVDPPHFAPIGSVGAISRDTPTVVSAAITGIAETELRDMWLHVRDAEGTWKRFEMTLLRAPGGIVGVAVFPVALLGSDGGTVYYMSAAMQVGDEYYTEIRSTKGRTSSATSAPTAAKPVVATPPRPHAASSGASTP